MGLLRRRLRCHGCNKPSRNEQAGIPRAWVCPFCTAVNHLDERGQITDPPAEVTARVQPLHRIRPQPARAPTPDMIPPAEIPFCDRCQSNHLVVTTALSNYLPDEDHPRYSEYEASLGQYRADLEERFPPVCENCIDRVQDHIRRAGYAAKADNLRRKLEQSKLYEAGRATRRQFWTIIFVRLGQWIYLSSVFAGLLWHGFGAIAYFDFGPAGRLNWSNCVSEVINRREVGVSCLVSPTVLNIMRWALFADLITIFWNPKLAHKMKHPSSHMSGVISLWIIRAIILVFRILGYIVLTEEEPVAEYLDFFHYTHVSLLAILVLSTYVGWGTVTTKVVLPKRNNREPLEAHLPTVSRSGEKRPRAEFEAVHPESTSFDSMAAGLASNFPGDTTAAYPPSPTLTATSVGTTEDTESPIVRRTPAKRRTEDDMDWTPTRPRFSANPPPIFRTTFGAQASPSQPPQPAQREPVSIFSTRDPNPFRHKIPAAPKAPAAAKADPWRKGIWAPQPKEQRRNFFEEDKEMNKSLGTGLSGRGVPRQVEEQARLFAPPKFKYDSYAPVKETGLEDTFNHMFSN